MIIPVRMRDMLLHEASARPPDPTRGLRSHARLVSAAATVLLRAGDDSPRHIDTPRATYKTTRVRSACDAYARALPATLVRILTRSDHVSVATCSSRSRSVRRSSLPLAHTQRSRKQRRPSPPAKTPTQ